MYNLTEDWKDLLQIIFHTDLVRLVIGNKDAGFNHINRIALC